VPPHGERMVGLAAGVVAAFLAAALVTAGPMGPETPEDVQEQRARGGDPEQALAAGWGVILAVLGAAALGLVWLARRRT
jgi:hypothetical protein